MARIKQRQVIPGVKKNLSQAVKTKSNAVITANQVIVVAGANGGFLQSAPADGDLGPHVQAQLMVADFGVPTNTVGSHAIPWKILEGQNTNGLAVGQHVYLSSTAGGYSTTAATYRIPIGFILEVHATTGRVLLCPVTMPRTISGRAAVSAASDVTVTLDASLDGKPVTATCTTNNASRSVQCAVWNGSGGLVITFTGTYTGNVDYTIGL